MEILSEPDCFGRAFLALEKIKAKEELLVSPSAKTQATIEEMTVGMKEMMGKMASQMDARVGSISTEADTQENRPRLLVLAGSGTGFVQVSLSQNRNEIKLKICNTNLKCSKQLILNYYSLMDFSAYDKTYISEIGITSNMALYITAIHLVVYFLHYYYIFYLVCICKCIFTSFILQVYIYI